MAGLSYCLDNSNDRHEGSGDPAALSGELLGCDCDRLRLELKCHALYSEDLSHGQHYEAIEVVKPFLNILPA